MREEILKRIDALLTTNPNGHEAFSGALGLLTSLYGTRSPQVDDLTRKGQSLSVRQQLPKGIILTLTLLLAAPAFFAQVPR